MEYSVCWLAIKCTSADDACGSLGLARDGHPYEIFPYALWGTALPTGWYLMASRWAAGHLALVERDLAALSLAYDVMACRIREHREYSAVSRWSGGVCIWSVAYDSKRGAYHLDVTGYPPESLMTIRADMWIRQREESQKFFGVDFTFDVPLELAREITGYRYGLAGSEGPRFRFEKLYRPEAR